MGASVLKRRMEGVHEGARQRHATEDIVGSTAVATAQRQRERPLGKGLDAKLTVHTARPQLLGSRRGLDGYTDDSEVSVPI